MMQLLGLLVLGLIPGSTVEFFLKVGSSHAVYGLGFICNLGLRYHLYCMCVLCSLS